MESTEKSIHPIVPSFLLLFALFLACGLGSAIDKERDTRAEATGVRKQQVSAANIQLEITEPVDIMSLMGWDAYQLSMDVTNTGTRPLELKDHTFQLEPTDGKGTLLTQINDSDAHFTMKKAIPVSCTVHVSTYFEASKEVSGKELTLFLCTYINDQIFATITAPQA